MSKIVKVHIFTIFLFANIFFIQSVSAEIYKCNVDGDITYSEQRCDGEKEKMLVEPAQLTSGDQKNKKKTEKMTELLASDRKVRELERDIKRQEKHILKLKTSFKTRMAEFEEIMVKSKKTESAPERRKTHDVIRKKQHRLKQKHRSEMHAAKKRLKRLRQRHKKATKLAKRKAKQAEKAQQE